MKAAVLISGEPRFCAEFDQLVDTLKGFDQIDWYFYLWERSQNTHNQVAVSNSWLNVSGEDWAKETIQNNLPQGHRVAGLELVDQTQFQFPNRPHPSYVNPRNIWIMYQGNYGAYKMIDDPNSYDLIIRARPDVNLDREVDLQEVKRRLEQNPNSIFSGGWATGNGYGYKINDWVGMGLPNTMNTYCDLINRMEQYANEGIPVHGETMLAYHLHKEKVDVQTDLFDSYLRILGTRNNEVYHSNFGRWV